jgi:hypothetical protein
VTIDAEYWKWNRSIISRKNYYQVIAPGISTQSCGIFLSFGLLCRTKFQSREHHGGKTLNIKNTTAIVCFTNWRALQGAIKVLIWLPEIDIHALMCSLILYWHDENKSVIYRFGLMHALTDRVVAKFFLLLSSFWFFLMMLSCIIILRCLILSELVIAVVYNYSFLGVVSVPSIISILFFPPYAITCALKFLWNHDFDAMLSTYGLLRNATVCWCC